MRCRRLFWVVTLTSLAALAAACGGDGSDAASEGASGQQFVGRVPLPTPTLAPALAEATQAASVPYRGAISGGVETGELTAEQAGDHVGKQGKVCGTVMSSVHEPEHRLKITFLNIDKAEDPDFYVFFPYIGQRFGNWPDSKRRLGRHHYLVQRQEDLCSGPHSAVQGEARHLGGPVAPDRDTGIATGTPSGSSLTRSGSVAENAVPSLPALSHNLRVTPSRAPCPQLCSGLQKDEGG